MADIDDWSDDDSAQEAPPVLNNHEPNSSYIGKFLGLKTIL